MGSELTEAVTYRIGLVYGGEYKEDERDKSLLAIHMLILEDKTGKTDSEGRPKRYGTNITSTAAANYAVAAGALGHIVARWLERNYDEHKDVEAWLLSNELLKTRFEKLVKMQPIALRSAGLIQVIETQ